MMMPDKCAFELCDLDVRIVELSKDFRAPVIVELIKFLGEIDPFHRTLLHFALSDPAKL